MSTGSRSFRAASSGQVKQELVRLLFGHKYARKGHEAHRKLDSSTYTFADLRKAYLNRIQKIHPDKIRDSRLAEELRQSFHELHDAWMRYEELAKTMRTVGNGVEDANFTMFGVGCSFSDTDEERALREEITEQACRGWFSSGLLAETSEANRNDTAPLSGGKQASLLDDNLFTDVTKGPEDGSDKGTVKPNATPRRKSLIPGWH